MDLHMELHIDIHIGLHVELHLEPHMEIHVEVHMELHIYVYIYIQDFQGQGIPVKAGRQPHGSEQAVTFVCCSIVITFFWASA